MASLTAGRMPIRPRLTSPRSRWLPHRKPVRIDRVPENVKKHGRRRGGRIRHETSTGRESRRTLFGLAAGASGCAGFPQRTTGTSPWAARLRRETASPPGLFSWWHRSPSRVDAAPADSTRLAETARPSQGNADASQTATNPWPETQSEWMARTFPRFNRLWNGTPAARPAGGPDANGVLWTNRTCDDSPAADAEVTASAPRSDGAVRPTEGASPLQTASKPGRSGVQAPYFDNLPFSPTPPSVKSPRPTTPDPASEATSDPSRQLPRCRIRMMPARPTAPGLPPSSPKMILPRPTRRPRGRPELAPSLIRPRLSRASSRKFCPRRRSPVRKSPPPPDATPTRRSTRRKGPPARPS